MSNPENASSLRTVCRVCGTVVGQQTYAIKEMMFGTRDVFHYALCASCGSLQIVDAPADMGRYYPAAYYSLNRPSGWSCPSWLKVLGRHYLARDFLHGRRSWPGRLALALGASLPAEVAGVLDYLWHAGIDDCGSAILDVGCGSFPHRLHALRACGFRNLSGIDPYIAGDATQCGVKLIKGDLDAACGRYDLIMFHHSFEHHSDPHQTLGKALALLQPGGIVLIRTPVMGSPMWEEYGTDWVELDAPRHMMIYSRAAMELLARAHGLELFNVVHDSGSWELIASEQYRRGIPWRSARSYQSDPAHSVFSPEDLQHFDEKVRLMNQRHLSGRAGYYFRERKA